MMTYGMGGGSGSCTAIDIKWVIKKRKLKFKISAGS